MIAHLKKWWAAYGTTIAGGVLYFLDPSVHAFIATHPAYALLGSAWVLVLHLLPSPVVKQ